QQQEIVEDEAVARRPEHVLRGGEMDVAKRVGQRGERAASTDPGRQRIGDGGGVLVDQRSHDLAKWSLREPLRRRVDGDEATGVEELVIVVPDDLEIRMPQGQDIAIALDLAVQHETLASLEHA